MKKYNKITKEDVLIIYYKTWLEYWDFPYNIPIEIIKEKLNAPLYKIRQIYKELKDLGYMEMIKIPTKVEEYDNGLYTQDIAWLYTWAYDISDLGKEKAKELITNVYK